jgi:hypothetical protein
MNIEENYIRKKEELIMTILAVSGLNLNSQKKTKSNNVNNQFNRISHSNIQMKDSVSFGSIPDKAPSKALTIVKELFTNLSAKPDAMFLKKDLMKLQQSTETAVAKIKEDLSSFHDLTLSSYSLEVDTLNKTSIYGNFRDKEFCFQQFDSNNNFMKSLNINPRTEYVTTTVITETTKPLIQKSFYSFDGSIKEAQIIKFTNSKMNKVNQKIQTVPCSHIKSRL